MNQILEIKKLVEELNKASEAYYNTGNTIMSDKEFDTKLAELELLEQKSRIVMSNSPTQRVGAPVLTKLDKVTHDFKPMLSLAKVHSAEEIIKFANGKELIAMVKLDGLSCRLTYHYGVLSKAETRGDGVTGSDITMHVKQFENVPLVINNNAESYVVDGEAIITDTDFESINAALPDGTEKFKNSRNLASGTLALLDTSLVKERHLRFVAWDVIKGTLTKKMTDRLDEVRELGFEIVPYVFDLCQHAVIINEKEINTINDYMFKEAKDSGYPIDGVVWKLNNIKYGESLGQTSHHFCNAVAFKAMQDVYETTLKNIEWTMGKTGVLTPVAIFNPVEIDGTTVEKASLHNISIMRELLCGDELPYVGQVVEVYKANQIIPQIKKAYFDYNKARNLIDVPKKCPVCGGNTEIKKDNDTEVLVCTNNNCKGKLLGQLAHFVSKHAMNIDGLSESTLEKLISMGWVNSFIDIYKLHQYRSEMQMLEGFGSKSVAKLLLSIQNSRNTDLAHFLNALGIPGCGKSTSKDIATYCKDNLDTFLLHMDTSSAREFLNINGIGKTLVDSMYQWYRDVGFDVIFELVDNYIIIETNDSAESYDIITADLSGKTYVITGSLNLFKSRDGLKELIESLGGKVSGSVSAKTTALINNDINSTSSKNKKAKDLGVSIITEREFLDSIGY